MAGLRCLSNCLCEQCYSANSRLKKTTDDDFEFFNLNPNPTQIRGYMTGVRNKAKEEERARIVEWIRNHAKFADPLPVQNESDKNWEIHYEGYRDAIDDVIDYLID